MRTKLLLAGLMITLSALTVAPAPVWAQECDQACQQQFAEGAESLQLGVKFLRAAVNDSNEDSGAVLGAQDSTTGIDLTLITLFAGIGLSIILWPRKLVREPIPAENGHKS